MLFKGKIRVLIKIKICTHFLPIQFVIIIKLFFVDQLLVLQKQSLAEGKTVIPRVQSVDEVEKLTGALRRIEPGKTVLENPSDTCLSCIRTTNRCFHATHAYTGVPCAAYST